jgi:hypothetical protein
VERIGLWREAFWALVAQVAVRPVIVGLAAVVFNDYTGFGQPPELLPVEVLIAQTSMETLDENILPGSISFFVCESFSFKLVGCYKMGAQTYS